MSEFSALVEKDRNSTAELLAYVGEILARRLYRDAGYPSMYTYCVGELHMSEDVAWKRTRVAALARRFPVILDMVAEGRLHLTAVVHLLPYRNAPDFPRLLEAAAHKTKSEIELLLAQRLPRSDAPTLVQPIPMSEPCQGMAPEPDVTTHISSGTPAVRGPGNGSPMGPEASLAQAPATSGQPHPAPERLAQELVASPEPIANPEPRARVQPLAPQRFAIQVTVGRATHDKLRRAQELLGRQVAPGDLEQVLDRALDALIRQLEHARFAATNKPRAARQASTSGKRHIPAKVKRAVYERDGGRCTFVSQSGHRCEERRDLEYDHVQPFARGGKATVAGMRLRCRAHNQLEAERTYGAGFMACKRQEARARRAVPHASP